MSFGYTSDTESLFGSSAQNSRSQSTFGNDSFLEPSAQSSLMQSTFGDDPLFYSSLKDQFESILQPTKIDPSNPHPFMDALQEKMLLLQDWQKYSVESGDDASWAECFYCFKSLVTDCNAALNKIESKVIADLGLVAHGEAIKLLQTV